MWWHTIQKIKNKNSIWQHSPFEKISSAFVNRTQFFFFILIIFFSSIFFYRISFCNWKWKNSFYFHKMVWIFKYIEWASNWLFRSWISSVKKKQLTTCLSNHSHDSFRGKEHKTPNEISAQGSAIRLIGFHYIVFHLCSFSFCLFSLLHCEKVQKLGSVSKLSSN